MTPCSPGMISGLWSTSAKASLSSSIKDSFLRPTTSGLNVLICKIQNFANIRTWDCFCLYSERMRHINRAFEVIFSFKNLSNLFSYKFTWFIWWFLFSQIEKESNRINKYPRTILKWRHLLHHRYNNDSILYSTQQIMRFIFVTRIQKILFWLNKITSTFW